MKRKILAPLALILLLALWLSGCENAPEAVPDEFVEEEIADHMGYDIADVKIISHAPDVRMRLDTVSIRFTVRHAYGTKTYRTTRTYQRFAGSDTWRLLRHSGAEYLWCSIDEDKLTGVCCCGEDERAGLRWEVKAINIDAAAGTAVIAYDITRIRSGGELVHNWSDTITLYAFDAAEECTDGFCVNLPFGYTKVGCDGSSMEVDNGLWIYLSVDGIYAKLQAV